MGCSASKRSATKVASEPEEPTPNYTADVASTVMRKSTTAFARESLSVLLRDEDATRYFREFLIHDYADVSLDFYEDVTKLLELDASTADSDVELAKRAKQIDDQYIRPGANREVNLPSNLIAACRRDTDASSKRAVLERCREEILRLLAFDSLPRFLKSPAYGAMLEHRVLLGSRRADHLLVDQEHDRTVSTSNAIHSSVSTCESWLQRFSAMADLLPVCITLADFLPADMPLVYVNAEFLRVSGYAWEDVCDRNCRFLQGPETSAAAVKLIRDSIVNRADVCVEILNYRKDGSQFRNLLAMRHVIEYASEADAHAKHAGKYRYIIGVQHEVTSDSMLESRLIQLGALVKLLPRVIIAS